MGHHDGEQVLSDRPVALLNVTADDVQRLLGVQVLSLLDGNPRAGVVHMEQSLIVVVILQVVSTIIHEHHVHLDSIILANALQHFLERQRKDA